MADLKQQVEARFDEAAGELRELSEWMYHNPELAYVEIEASKRLVDLLSKHGFEVEFPAYGLDTAFAARIGDGGPEMIVCAEYDALPGVGHACGHNIIATAAAGAGIALAPFVQDLGFRLTVLGTPAEEKYGGKVDLIRAGAFEDAAAAMMIHPTPEDTLDPKALAIAHLTVEFRGKEAHASGSPWDGVNALDAFVSLYTSVSNFRQQMRPTDKMHGIPTHGGDAPNIIPSKTTSDWYVRAATKERLDFLMDRFRGMVEGAAAATGCESDISEQGYEYEDLVSDPVMTELFDANAKVLGREMQRGDDQDPSAAGSTDMGNVSHVVPSIHPMIGLDTQGAVNHQPEFAAHTITDDGHKAMRDGALGMAWTILDVASGDRWKDLGSS